MKRYIIYILLSGILLHGFHAYAYDIRVANKEGWELCYNILYDGKSVAFTRDVIAGFSDSTYKYILADTLYIPDKVVYDGKEYFVTATSQNAFTNMTPRVKVVILPYTIQDIFYEGTGVSQRAATCSFAENRLEEIIVEASNPHFKSKQGILFTHDMKTLIAYPTLNPKDSVFLDEGISYIAPSAFLYAANITFVDLPLSLKKIGAFAFCDTEKLAHIILKDNVDSLMKYAFSSPSLTHLTLGNGVKYVDQNFVSSDSVMQMYCRATSPPTIRNPHLFLQEVDATSSLYVPGKSIALYRQAEGWNKFTILPIEPPIVAGVDEMTVSWVQNFSATGYVWTLYSDESNTDMVMSLTFNEKGYLTDIVLGSLAPNRTFEANAPSIDTPLPDSCGGPVMRISAADGDNMDEGERRFAEYYSFTIKSLTPNTKYYYTRQTLADDEVIDEEHGSFATLPDTGTGMEQHPSMEVPAVSNKLIRDGQLQIRCQDKTYTVQGIETK